MKPMTSWSVRGWVTANWLIDLTGVALRSYNGSSTTWLGVSCMNCVLLWWTLWRALTAPPSSENPTRNRACPP